MTTLEPVLELRRRLAGFPLKAFVLGTSSVFIVLGAIGAWIAFSLSLCSNNDDVGDIFGRSLLGLFNPLDWIKIPSVENFWLLLLPSLLLLILVRGIILCSPRPKKWSRGVVVSLLLVLTCRYILWRSLQTLNFSNPINGLFSLLLWFLEMVVLSGSLIQLGLMFNIKYRGKEADSYRQSALDNHYLPSVDILIPTYNEPEFILKRTVIGCQSIDYPNKHIYILDDTGRKEIEALAGELGCNYRTRPDNRHAKAGNLNHALLRTQGDLIAVFDADFIPCRNFLERTVGFFQNPKIALVQTPQSFYNADPIAYNLGLEKIVTPEEEVFYRHIQPLKDGAGAVVCAGTSFVVRRSALKEVGYFNTESLSEDYFTGITLSAKGGIL